MRRLASLIVVAILLGGCAGMQRSGTGSLKDSMTTRESANNLNADQEIRLGQTYLSQGKPELALLAFSRAAAKDPENLEARVCKGEALAAGGMTEDALKEFQAVLAKNPEHAAANEGAALVFMRSGLNREAEVHLRKAVAVNPNLWRSRNALGVLNDQRGEYEKAAKEFEAALALSPNNGQVLNNLGVVRLMSSDPQKAVTALRAALKAGVSSPRVYNNLGLALARMGREQEALEAFRYGGDEARALNNLGYVLLLQGRHDRAAVYFEKALHAAPTYYVKAAENLKRSRMAAQAAGGDSPVASAEPLSGMAFRARTLDVSPATHHVSSADETLVRKGASLPKPRSVKETDLGAEEKPAVAVKVQPDAEAAAATPPRPQRPAEEPAAAQAVKVQPPAVEKTAGHESAPAPVTRPVPAAATAENVPAAPSGGVDTYGILASSWRSPEDAARHVKQLESKGLVCTVLKADLGDKGLWYRVMVGRYVSLAEARRQQEDVQARIGITGQAPVFRLRGTVDMAAAPTF